MSSHIVPEPITTTIFTDPLASTSITATCLIISAVCLTTVMLSRRVFAMHRHYDKGQWQKLAYKCGGHTVSTITHLTGFFAAGLAGVCCVSFITSPTKLDSRGKALVGCAMTAAIILGFANLASLKSTHSAQYCCSIIKNRRKNKQDTELGERPQDNENRAEIVESESESRVEA